MLLIIFIPISILIILFIVSSWSRNWVIKNSYSDFLYCDIPRHEYEEAIKFYKEELRYELKEFIIGTIFFPIWIVLNKIKYNQPFCITVEQLQLIYKMLFR